MKEAVSFLTFDGNCREAMEFYRNCFAAELFLLPYSEAPGDLARHAASAKDRIMHSSLTAGSLTVLMAADALPGMPFRQGNNFSVAVRCETREEIDSLFTALGEGGKVTLPLQKTFWSPRFGMLTDRFGIDWMFNLCQPPPAP